MKKTPKTLDAQKKKKKKEEIILTFTCTKSNKK